MNIDALRDRLLDYPNNVLEGSPLLREAAKAIEYLDATGIHSCSPYCDNWACVMRRENEALKVDLGRVRELLRLTWMTGAAASEEFAEQVLDELDKQAKDKKRKRVRKP
jgi:hypothetical protein